MGVALSGTSISFFIQTVYFINQNLLVLGVRPDQPQHLGKAFLSKFSIIMNTQEMTRQESLDLIAEMIESTKHRYHLNDGNIFLFWGYLSVATCLLVWALLSLTANPLFNLLWLLIPIFGGLYTVFQKYPKKNKGYVKTFTDRIIGTLWSLIGSFAWVLLIICFAVQFFFGHGVWFIMLVYAFLVVGIGSAVTGIVVQERSLVVGGCFSAIAGSLFLIAQLMHFPMKAMWVVPLYIVCFMVMMVVPGHIINAKARRQSTVETGTNAPSHAC